MMRDNTSYSVIVTLVTITLKEVFTLCMTGYNYTKRSVCSLHGWLQFPSKKCSLSAWLVTITLKEVFILFMAGYNYTKRSVHTSFSVIVTSHAESEQFF
jgi:hypothetical protein